jgi:glutathione synthase
MPKNPIRLGVLMDPISSIHYKKDSTLAMLWEAQRRDWGIYYFEQADLFLQNGKACARLRELRAYEDPQHWFDFGEELTQELHPAVDVILMRKDPPFNMEYIYTTYLLELAERSGVLVVNKPQALRDANEKLFTTWFPQYMPPTLVSRDANLLKQFIHEHKESVLKPLHSMGGGSIFYLKENDVNTNVVIETLTQNGQAYIMAQRFIPEVKQGDKRIFLINGEAVPYALARIPQQHEIRGNLAAGGEGVGVEITEHDKKICTQIGPILREKGLWLVGIDIIGNYLTEINVTSPTCIREIDKFFNINISAQFLDFIENKLA